MVYLYIVLESLYTVTDPQEFQNGGGRGRIFRSGVCFDAPSHIPYVFAARVVDKIHTVNIVY